MDQVSAKEIIHKMNTTYYWIHRVVTLLSYCALKWDSLRFMKAACWEATEAGLIVGIHLTGQGCSRVLSGVKVEGSAAATELETWRSKSQGPNTWVSSRVFLCLFPLATAGRTWRHKLHPKRVGSQGPATSDPQPSMHTYTYIYICIYTHRIYYIYI